MTQKSPEELFAEGCKYLRLEYKKYDDTKCYAVIKENDFMAKDYFEKAAEAGYAPAMRELARCYIEGYGIMIKNKVTKGIKFLCQAVLADDKNALDYCLEREDYFSSLTDGDAHTYLKSISDYYEEKVAKEVAKQEAERKAKEEAERKAKEEAERRAKEEAERKAKEEAERKAKEEAERKAKEEAERKAKEEAERKAKEDAERKAKEELFRQIERGTANPADICNLAISYRESDIIKCINLLEEASKKNHYISMFNLGVIFETGAGSDFIKDKDKAFNCFQRVILSENKTITDGSCDILMNIEGDRFVYINVDSTSFPEFLPKLDNYARRFVSEYKVEKAEDKVDKDNPDDLFNLAEDFMHGKNDIPQNYDKGVYWYEKAATLGHVNAMCRLGMYYLKDPQTGILRDIDKAELWLRKASEGGCYEAMNPLAHIYTGNPFKLDYKNGFHWFSLSADKGNLNSKANVGWCYHFGHGTDKDLKEAIRWYEAVNDRWSQNKIAQIKASEEWKIIAAKDIEEKADLDDAQYLCQLGMWYQYGENDFPIDIDRAIYWYQKSAMAGNTSALSFMNMLIAEKNAKADEQRQKLQTDQIAQLEENIEKERQARMEAERKAQQEREAREKEHKAKEEAERKAKEKIERKAQEQQANEQKNKSTNIPYVSHGNINVYQDKFGSEVIVSTNYSCLLCRNFHRQKCDVCTEKAVNFRVHGYAKFINCSKPFIVVEQNLLIRPTDNSMWAYPRFQEHNVTTKITLNRISDYDFTVALEGEMYKLDTKEIYEGEILI